MKKNLVLMVLAVIVFSISSNSAEATDLVVVEVENLKLSNAEVRDLEMASGKVVAVEDIKVWLQQPPKQQPYRP